MATRTAPIARGAISAEEVHAELGAICRSRTFERSERLQRFLRYVCELTLKGEGSRINEYLIASEVFERGADYSPGEDSVVRRQAHSLRRKLQEYYSGEGREDAVRIDLPVGHYVPIFRNTTEPEPVVEPQLEPLVLPAQPATRQNRWTVPILWFAIAVLGGLAAGWFAARRLPINAARPLQSKFQHSELEIWGPWLEDPRGASICFSNPMTTVIKHFPADPPETPPNRFRATVGEEKRYREAFRLPPGGVVYSSWTWSQTKMGEAISGVHIGQLFGRAGVPLRAIESRFLSWDELRSTNVILFGHSEANRWLDPLLEKYPLRLAVTTGEGPRRIVNAAPRPGEAAEYHIVYSQTPNSPTQEYALISMIPGIDGRHRLLLINGLNAQATQAATEFLSNPETLDDFVRRLREAAPGHRGEWHFQAVLRSEVRDKVPTLASLVIVRVL